MFVTQDKKTALNEELVQVVQVNTDDSVAIAVGNNAVTLSGDDAKAAAGEFGVTLHADDAAAEAKKEKHDAANQQQGQQHPAQVQQQKK